MIIIAGTFRIPTENLERARPLMAEMIRETRAEEGCEVYAFAEDLMEPGLIRVSEVWRDQDCLKAHAASAHMARWRASGAELGVGDRNLSLYEAASARQL